MNLPEQATVHLVRHLATEGTPTDRLDRHNLQVWLDREVACTIRADAQPSDELVALVAGSRHLLVSPLARAQATASAVLDRLPTGSHPKVTTDDDLSEAPLPVLPVPRIRLPLDAWDVLCRTAWILGYSGNVEPRRQAVDRARRVAYRLGELTPTGNVSVIAHGFTNLLVARELRRLRWTGPRLPNHANGATSTFRTPPITP
jgi:broad specificity phosphatase PhoE